MNVLVGSNVDDPATDPNNDSLPLTKSSPPKRGTFQHLSQIEDSEQPKNSLPIEEKALFYANCFQNAITKKKKNKSKESVDAQTKAFTRKVMQLDKLILVC